MTVKVLHIADAHLTSRLDRSAREAERADRLLARLAEAKEEGAELLLIAGDLFDTPFESEALTARVFSALSALSVPVCLIAGNHDCACPGSVYRKTPLPENVHFLDEQNPVFRAEAYDVYGFSFTAPYENRRLLSGFAVEHPEKINFLLFHGELVSPGAASEYMPLTRDELAESGADYAALGHVHKRTPPEQAGKTTYAYAGIPDGRGFDELGEQGAWLLDVEKGRVTSTFFPVSGRRYLEQTVDLTGMTHTAACADKVLSELSGTREDAYKLHLCGKVLFPLSVKTLTEQLGTSLYFVKCMDECGEDTDLSDTYDDYSLVGLYQKTITERITACRDEVERQVLELARVYGLAALLDKPLKGVDD